VAPNEVSIDRSGRHRNSLGRHLFIELHDLVEDSINDGGLCTVRSLDCDALHPLEIVDLVSRLDSLVSS
jgi:hypothetical protein